MEPASAMKGLAAAAAVDRHLLALDEPLDCENGRLAIGGSEVSDWKPFKILSTTDTIVNSSNVCGIKIGERLGVAGLARMLTDFGFGAGGTTEGFPEAAPGEIPRPTQLTPEEYVALVAAGLPLQGHFAVTPLEMVQAYGAIANDGKLMKALTANEPASSASAVRQVIDPSTAESMKGVLAKVVTEGTGKHARSALYTTAGKTSSAAADRRGSTLGQSPAESESLDGVRAIAGFVGFAPVARPRVVVYVAIIDPTNSADGQAYGSEHAAPVFRQVAEQVLQYLNVPPDQR
jgi:cell division protein FtsI/penicillin-binding protein 2